MAALPAALFRLLFLEAVLLLVIGGNPVVCSGVPPVPAYVIDCA